MGRLAFEAEANLSPFEKMRVLARLRALLVIL